MKTHQLINLFVPVIFFLSWPFAVPGLSAADTDMELKQKAGHACQMGDFAACARLWEALAGQYEASGAYLDQARSLIHVSEACQALGNVRKAAVFLDRAEQILSSLHDATLMLQIHAGRGKIHYLTGENEQAAVLFKKGLDLAEDKKNNQTASIFLNYANILFAQHHYDQALKHYTQCLILARELDNHPLAIKAAINLSRTHFALNDDRQAVQLLNQAFVEAYELADSHDKTFCLISIGTIANHNAMPDLAWKSLAASLETALSTADTRSYSQGLGALGALYADNGQPKESVSSYQRAIFSAHEAGAVDLLYRWQWEIGRQYTVLGDIHNAIHSYEQSVEHISLIKDDLAIDCKKNKQAGFRESVGLVYFELADLLLKRSAIQIDVKLKQADLQAAQNTIEQMKKMELEDYFQDDCVTSLKARQSALNESIPGTAVIYPVLLADRLELIVTFPGIMNSYPVMVNRNDLISHVRNLRKKLQIPESRFLRHSQKLYDWLVRPFESDLAAHQITTLVFVPDGPLRTIPMSVLHDKHQYLIEKFAVATTPGLIVTDLVPFHHQGTKILLGGITEAVQGYSSLPGVGHELVDISRIYDSQVLMDKAFDNVAIQKSLQLTPYSIVHIASHGQFDKDPSHTFVLTHNDQLTLDGLERLMGLSNYRKEPVALLTLSACQTAVGDDRAALGLAGVAVKSGARCALASLWFINDTATSRMVVDFYRHLSMPMSKAKALQRAQTAMIQSKDYRHPAYWAPFLLIGNWL